MKAYDNLWDRICNIKNFWAAYRQAVKGKRHYREVKEIEHSGVNRYLRHLLRDIKSGEYRVSQYSVFHRFTGGKDREIYKLPMRDRIVQHAIMIHIEKIFRNSFIADTFSSMKGRGIHSGLYVVRKDLRKSNCEYYLKLDITKCYPSIDQNILKKMLAKKFKDKRLLTLLYTIIDSCENGVPIGNYTSQYFNNFYLSDIDHYVKDFLGVKYYYRYCDDMIILGETKQYLWSVYRKINQRVRNLNMKLKNNYQIYKVDEKGIDFLGYKIFKTHTIIRTHTKNNFIRKTSKMNFKNLTDKNINVLGSYWGIFKHGDCRRLWRIYTHNYGGFQQKNKKHR